MNGLSVEESNLISIYEGKSRAEVIEDISMTMGYLKDNDLLELSKRVVERLEGITDEEFATLEFVAAE